MFLIQLPIVLLFMLDIHLKEVPGIPHVTLKMGHHGLAHVVLFCDTEHATT